MTLRVDGVSNREYNWTANNPPADYLSLFSRDPNLSTLWYQTDSFPRMNEAFSRVWKNRVLPSSDYDEVQRFSGFMVNRLLVTQPRTNMLIFSQPTPLLLCMYYIKSSYRQGEMEAAREGIIHLRDMLQIVRRAAGTNISLYNAPDFSEYKPWDNRDEFRGWLIGSVEKIYNFGELESFAIDNHVNIYGMPELVSMLTRNDRVDPELNFAVWKYFLQSDQKGLYNPSNNFISHTNLQASGTLNNKNYTVRVIERSNQRFSRNYSVQRGNEAPVTFHYPSELLEHNFTLAEVEHISNLTSRVIYNPTLDRFAEMINYTGNNRTLENMHVRGLSERYQKYYNELSEFHLEDLFNRYEYGQVFGFIDNYYYNVPVINHDFLRKSLQRKGLNPGRYDIAQLATGKKDIIAADYRLRIYQTSEDYDLLDQVEPLANRARGLQANSLSLIENFDEDTDIFWLSMTRMMFLSNYYKISEQYDKAREIYSDLYNYDTVTDPTQRRQIQLGLAESDVGLYIQNHDQTFLTGLERMQGQIYSSPEGRRSLPIDDQIRLVWMDVNIAAEQFNIDKIDRVINDYIEPQLDRHDKMNVLYPQILVTRADTLGQMGRTEEATRYLLDHNIPQWIDTHVYNARARNVLNFKYELLLANFYIQANKFSEAEDILNRANQRLNDFRTDNIHFYRGNFLKIRSLQLDLYWKAGRADKLEELYQPYRNKTANELRRMNIGEREFAAKLIVKMMTMAVRRHDFAEVDRLKNQFDVLGIAAARKGQAEILIEYRLQLAEREKYYGRYSAAKGLIDEAQQLLSSVKKFRQREIYTKIVNMAYAHYYAETRNWTQAENYYNRLIYSDPAHQTEFTIDPTNGLHDEEFYFQGKVIHYQRLYAQGNYAELAEQLRTEIRRANSLLSDHSDNLLAQHITNYRRELELLYWRCTNATFANNSQSRGYETDLNTIKIVTRADKDLSLRLMETWFNEKRTIVNTHGILGESLFYRVGQPEMQAGLARAYNELEGKDNYFSAVIAQAIPRLPIPRERLEEIFGLDRNDWPNLSSVFVSTTGEQLTFKPNAQRAIRALDIARDKKERLLELFRQSSLFTFGKGELDDTRRLRIVNNIARDYVDTGIYRGMGISEKRSFIEGWIEACMRCRETLPQARAAIRFLYFGQNSDLNDPLIRTIREYRSALPTGYTFTRAERGFAYVKLLKIALERRDNQEFIRVLRDFLKERFGDKSLTELLSELTRRDSYDEPLYLTLKFLEENKIVIRNLNIQEDGENIYSLINWSKVRRVISRMEENIQN